MALESITASACADSASLLQSFGPDAEVLTSQLSAGPHAHSGFAPVTAAAAHHIKNQNKV